MDWLTALWLYIVAHWGWITVAGLPFIVAAIARVSWSNAAKVWLAFAVSAVYGVGAALVAGIPIVPANLGVLAATVFTATTLVYQLFKSQKITCKWLEDLLKWGSPHELSIKDFD